MHVISLSLAQSHLDLLQLTLILLSNFMNLLKLTQSHAFYQMFSLTLEHSDIILSVPIGCLVPLSLLNSNFSSHMWWSILNSSLRLRILVLTFPACSCCSFFGRTIPIMSSRLCLEVQSTLPKIVVEVVKPFTSELVISAEISSYFIISPSS